VEVVSPRQYRLGERQQAVDETRARIVAAARELLAATGGIRQFTVDAVARQADVARQTVYYQYGSKTGLLEAVCDAYAGGGGIDRLPSVFQTPDPLEALDAFVEVFAGLYTSDRLLSRRLQGLAAVDPDLERVLLARAQRRVTGATVLLERLSRQTGLPTAEGVGEAAATVAALTGFACMDALAGPSRSPLDVVSLVQRLVRAALGLPAP